MASIYDLKPRFQAFLRPWCAALATRGITANQVTAAALVLSALHGLWIGVGPLQPLALVLLPLTLFLRMALNAIDGMLAREFDQKTRFGALFNEIADVAADAALYLPLAFVAGIAAPLLTAVVTLGLIAEFTGAIAPQIGAPRRYDGPFGKSDRAVYFGLLAFLTGIGLFAPGWATLYLWLGVVLGLLCIVNRIRKALH